MGLLNLFKKSKPESDKIIQKADKLIVRTHPTISIHDDLKGLVWIGDGPYKNYIADDGNKNTFDVDGIKITFSFMNQEEPSLIFNKQKINIPKNEKAIERPPYFPTYSQLTPEQKWIYLKLLSNPYDSSIDIGYVFILYYGLERHLLCGDFESAFRVILKLRDVHSNKSFQSYSANALVLTSMLHKKGEFALEFIKSIDKDYELAFSDNLFLICYYSFNIPLQAKDIMRMSKTFEFTNKNYIKKYPEIFEECLKNLIVKRLGKEQIEIGNYITKTELRKIRTQDVRIFSNTSIIDKTYPVPMISENFKLKKEMNIFLETAHEMVKQKLAEMRKSGVEIPTSSFPKKQKKVLVFDENQEKILLQELKKNQDSPLGKHFCYIQLQDFYYKYRVLNEEYLNKCINYCFLDIKSLDEMQNDYIKQEIVRIRQLSAYQEKGYEQNEIERVRNEGFIGNIPAFSRLSIIYEKKRKLEKAIKICDMAIKYGQSVDSFTERKEKLLKKMNLK